jgi:hypothetical protein
MRNEDSKELDFLLSTGPCDGAPLAHFMSRNRRLFANDASDSTAKPTDRLLHSPWPARMYWTTSV